MKIVLHSYNYSGYDRGIAIVTKHSMTRLLKKGHEVHIIAQRKNLIDPNKRLKHYEVMDGLKVHRLNRGRIPVLSTLLYYRKVLKLIKHLKPDIVHEQGLSGIGYFAKKLYNIPYVVFGHGIDIFKPQWVFKLLLGEKIMKQADAVISNTEQMARYIQKHWARRNISIVRNGIDVAAFNKAKRNSHRGIRFISVGRMIQSKGFDTTIKAFAKVNRKYPTSRLILIGSGKEEHNLKQIVKELGITDAVTFVGQVPHKEVIRELTNADIFVLPTYHKETCCLAILEAMAAGLPVVSTNIQANPELVVEGENGFLLQPKDVDAFAEKMQYLLENRAVRYKIRKKNKERSKLFAWSRIAKNLEVVYKNITSSSP